VAQVVCVHGVGQQRETEQTLHTVWAPALCGGVALAGGQLAEAQVRCALYGDLFRPPGRHLAAGDPLIRPEDLDRFEVDLLAEWWAEAARTDPAVLAPDARTLARAPRSVQTALRALSGSRFFAALGERALMRDLRQVRDYFDIHKPEIRQQALQRVSEAVGDDTQVLVGHSLGSVVAYEALSANREWPVRMLVTLGSPLGIPNLIFDQLQPAPLSAADAGRGPRGRWPGPGRLATPMSQAGRSNPARVVTPAPPCAPTRTTPPGGASRGEGASPARRGRGSAVIWYTAHLLRRR